MMLLHLVFSIFSFSSGLPGGNFIPTLVTGGLLGQIVALIMVRQGPVSYTHLAKSPLTGIVRIQAVIMLLVTPQRTAERRFVAPTPMIAPVIDVYKRQV